MNNRTLNNQFNDEPSVFFQELTKRLAEISGGKELPDTAIIKNNETEEICLVDFKNGSVLRLNNFYALFKEPSVEIQNQNKRMLEDDIDALKKRIKHSKNPFEKKNLEKQLNRAYKNRKNQTGVFL